MGSECGRAERNSVAGGDKYEKDGDRETMKKRGRKGKES